MQRTPVKSSNIRSVGHDGQALEVEFSSGAVYRYPGVPAALHGELLKSPSVGKHFNAHVRGKFSGEKVTPRPAAGAEPDAEAPC